MKEYKCLNEQIISNGRYSIVPIRFEDRKLIMKWRNEQIYHLRQAKPLTKEKQDWYFNNVVVKLFEQEQPGQILFSFLKEDKCIGYGGLVHINWIDKNAEVSFIMNTNLEKEFFEFHWVTYLNLIEDVAYNQLNLKKIFTYAYDIRPHLFKAVEKAGFKKEASLIDHCKIQGIFYDVIIHSKFNKNINFRKLKQSDLDLTFQWTNETETRENSFFSEKISIDEHKNWFNRKIADPNLLYFVTENLDEPIGLLRFDEMNDYFIIGINVASNYRRKGFGKIILENGIKLFNQISKKTIYAFIMPENIPSIKAFESSGFVFESKTIINNKQALKYKWC